MIFTKNHRESLLSLLAFNSGIANNWGVYLFSEDFKQESKLKNRIFCIWEVSLFDSLESEKQIVKKVLNYAKENKHISLHSLAEEIQRFISFTIDILSIYNMKEQVYITDFRDQLVHSSLNKYFNNHTTVKYIKNNELKKKKLTQEEYRDIILEFLGNNEVPDEILDDLRTRFVKQYLKPVNYSKALAVIRNRVPISIIRESLKKNKKIQIFNF